MREEFDPRRQPARYAPKLLALAAGLAALALGWRVLSTLHEPELRLRPAALDAAVTPAPLPAPSPAARRS